MYTILCLYVFKVLISINICHVIISISLSFHYFSITFNHIFPPPPPSDKSLLSMDAAICFNIVC